jgi:polar amino acid transport system substrate-binding protein
VQLQPTTSKAEEIEFTAPELLEFMDVQTIQSLMNDFYDIVNMPMAIVDIKGKVLAGVGWQRICLDFHRVNPDSCRNCMESDTKLTVGIRPGEYRLYKCRNNMWDVATPLMVGEQHVGNIFSGQFFFEDEAIDRKYFVQQARQYGFAEQQYLAALETVPRLSRKTVERATAFMMKLARILSEMGYSNLKMAQWMSERRQAEEALIRSEKLASAGRLAATVAHEINNPLEAATNCLYILKTNARLSPDLEGYLEVAQRELQRVAHIAKQTLGFYRENSKPASADIASLVDEVAALYNPRLRAKEIDLRIERGGGSTLAVVVSGEIRQVISNLLTNAIDASSLCGRVIVRTRGVSVNGFRYVRLTVADTGIGISHRNQQQIFRPFFTTKQAIGTGLGLWVSSEIVAKHSGRIRVRSIEGRGAVFSIFIPETAVSGAVLQ